VTDLAGRLEMSPSTTHRYLTTLLAVGLIEQDPRTRRYRVPVAV
jgi:DNA-binding IclR family transcriptional regulator